MTKSVLGKSMRLLTLVLVLMLLAALQVQAASKIYYVHSDHLATPQKLTDEAQNVVWSADYTPFGKAIVDEDPDGNGETVEMNIRFPGQYFDVATGLYYNYFRDYDPTLGRYIQSDPIGLGGGINTYAYVGGNPVSYFDFYGLSKTKGITKGNDPILNDYKDAAKRGDRSAIDKINKDAKNGEYGDLSKDRAKKNKAWHKLAKDGRLLNLIPPSLFGICLDTYKCWCINNPVECVECGI